MTNLKNRNKIINVNKKFCTPGIPKIQRDSRPFLQLMIIEK